MNKVPLNIQETANLVYRISFGFLYSIFPEVTFVNDCDTLISMLDSPSAKELVTRLKEGKLRWSNYAGQ